MNGAEGDLGREELIGLLRETGEILQARGKQAAIYVVGGAAMAMVFDSRRTTRDVDATFRGESDALREAASQVAQRHGLAPSWINANAAMFMSTEPDEAASEVTLPGLRITVASPEHLIAMKLRALRARDMDDLETLFRYLGLTDPAQAVEIHDRFFGESAIGYMPADEALYAAQQVFARAAAKGNPLTGPASPRN